MNKAQVIGRLGGEPEMKSIGETTLCNFSIATSKKWKDKNGEQQERIEWHNIITWGRLAEICGTYLHKGKQVYVEGELQTDSWETDSGEKRYATKIRAFQMEMLGSRGDYNEQGNDGYRQDAKPEEKSDFPPAPTSREVQDDLPF